MNYTITQTSTLSTQMISPDLLEAFHTIKWRIEKKKFIECFIEQQQDVITGIGLSWSNKYHPYAKYIHWIGCEQPEKMLRCLSENPFEFERIICHCESNEQERQYYLNQQDYQLFRETYIKDYTLEALQPYLTLKNDAFTFKSLEEVSMQPTLLQNLFSYVKNTYTETHLDNPVANFDWQYWYQLTLDDSPHCTLPCIATKGNSICGFIFIHIMSKSHVELGWKGFKDCTMLDLMSVIVPHLQAEGYKTIGVEIDTTSHYAMQFYELFPFEKTGPFLSFQLQET